MVHFLYFQFLMITIRCHKSTEGAVANTLVYHIYVYHNYSLSYWHFSILISSAKIWGGNDLHDFANDLDLEI